MSTNSNQNGTSNTITNNTNSVGVGVLSFSSSITPFSTTQANQIQMPNQQAQQQQSNNHQNNTSNNARSQFNVNNSTPSSSFVQTNAFSTSTSRPYSIVNQASSNQTHPGEFIQHSPGVYSCVSPTSGTLINNQLYTSANTTNNGGGSGPIVTRQTPYLTSSCNISSIQSHHHHHHHSHHLQSGTSSTVQTQTQLHPQGLTVTLIATIPTTSATNSTRSTGNSTQILTATPLMPLIQPIIQTQPQITQSPSALPTTPPTPVSRLSQSPSLSSLTPPAALSALTATTFPQQPSTSAVSSSSSSPISSAQNLSSTTRDWFTYVYQIDNIEDLIKNHESQQNFVQSPIFSFTNHVISSCASTASIPGNHSTQSGPNSASGSGGSQFANNNSIGGSGGIGVPIYTTNSSPGSSSGSSSIPTSFNSNDSAANGHLGSGGSLKPGGVSPKNQTGMGGNKQPSNWRLIFYPNGAGADCKNFLSIFLKYLSDEPVKIQMMFSIVDNTGEDVYVKYTVNKFCKSNDWGFKQLIHKNAILYQKEKFLKPYNGGTLSVRVKMRLDEQKHDYIKKLNDNLHYCKLLSENFSQYYYNNNILRTSGSADQPENQQQIQNTSDQISASFATGPVTPLASSSTQPSASSSSSSCGASSSTATSSSFLPSSSTTSQHHTNKFPVNSSNQLNSTGLMPLNNSLATTAANNSNVESSYYDILLMVKSKCVNVEAADESQAPNFMICNNCTATVQEASNKPEIVSYNSRRGLSDDESESPGQPPLKRLKSTHIHSPTSACSSQPTPLIIDNLITCFNCNSPATSTTTTTTKPASISRQYIETEKTELIEFRAHKCILAARSPVFKAMFNYKLKENLTNTVLIEDCRPDVVKAMLKYIYTAYLPDDIKPIAIDLYIAAEKYFIESLKIKCREFLIENLNTDNVVQIYILAELYNDSMLRKQSLKFISENIDKVTQDQDWNEFMLVYPQLFTNAFIRLCKKDF